MFGKKAPQNPPALPPLLPELKIETLKTAAARRFISFCQRDYPSHIYADGFDPAVYADAARLVIHHLEATRHRDKAS